MVDHNDDDEEETEGGIRRRVRIGRNALMIGARVMKRKGRRRKEMKDEDKGRRRPARRSRRRRSPVVAASADERRAAPPSPRDLRPPPLQSRGRLHHRHQHPAGQRGAEGGAGRPGRALPRVGSGHGARRCPAPPRRPLALRPPRRSVGC